MLLIIQNINNILLLTDINPSWMLTFKLRWLEQFRQTVRFVIVSAWVSWHTVFVTDAKIVCGVSFRSAAFECGERSIAFTVSSSVWEYHRIRSYFVPLWIPVIRAVRNQLIFTFRSPRWAAIGIIGLSTVSKCTTIVYSGRVYMYWQWRRNRRVVLTWSTSVAPSRWRLFSRHFNRDL